MTSSWKASQSRAVEVQALAALGSSPQYPPRATTMFATPVRWRWILEALIGRSGIVLNVSSKLASCLIVFSAGSMG